MHLKLKNDLIVKREPHDKMHLKLKSDLATTCQACTKNTLATGHAIECACEYNCEGLVFILSSRCAGCNALFIALQHPPGSKELLVVSTVNVTLLLCGGKWLQMEGTHH